jgi:SAM-dependent methyltransferase
VKASASPRFESACANWSGGTSSGSDKKRGLTQEQLVEISGFSQQYIKYVLGYLSGTPMAGPVAALDDVTRKEMVEHVCSSSDIPNASFDVVCCQQGLQFFPDRPAALREMHRALTPVGRLALAVWRGLEHQPFMPR